MSDLLIVSNVTAQTFDRELALLDYETRVENLTELRIFASEPAAEIAELPETLGDDLRPGG